MCSAIGFEYWSGMRQLDDVRLDAGQLLPHRAGEVARVERLQAGLVGHVEGHAPVLLGGLRRRGRPSRPPAPRSRPSWRPPAPGRAGSTGRPDRQPPRPPSSRTTPGRRRDRRPARPAAHRNSRRDVSPRSQASTSSDSPASKWRRSRSPFIVVPPDFSADAWTNPVGYGLPRVRVACHSSPDWPIRHAQRRRRAIRSASGRLSPRLVRVGGGSRRLTPPHPRFSRPPRARSRHAQCPAGRRARRRTRGTRPRSRPAAAPARRRGSCRRSAAPRRGPRGR